MKLATGIFVDSLFDLNSTFVDHAKNDLNSSVEKLNFSFNPFKERNYLNEWGGRLTNGLIKELFPEGNC